MPAFDIIKHIIGLDFTKIENKISECKKLMDSKDQTFFSDELLINNDPFTKEDLNHVLDQVYGIESIADHLIHSIKEWRTDHVG